MYGLKEETDVSFLNGREVIQVAVGRYQMIFAFDEDVTISVEGGWELHVRDSVVVWSPAESDAAAASLILLGATVTGVRKESNGTLKLEFSGVGTLVILDSNKQYESYQINKPGTTIVV